MFAIIRTSDNPPTLHSMYATEEHAKRILKALQEPEYKSVLKQAVDLYDKKYFLGVPKELIADSTSSIRTDTFEIQALN